jgi:hypothetical protein
MRHGWAYIYECPTALQRCEELLDHFSRDGVCLAEPTTGRVIRLSPVGEQIPSSKEDILKESACSPEVRFNLYLAPSTNIFCSIETISNEILRESYALDGKTDEESQRVIKNVAALFSIRARRGNAFGFAVDKYAELHADFHWDDFFVGDADVPPEWPLLLGCSKDFPKLNLIPDQLYIREEGQNFILFRLME